MQNYRLRIYYEDTDAGGVVYHARYLHFFERARTEYLRQLGFEQQQLLQEQSIIFVVKSMQIDYCIPAKLDDSLAVITEILKLNGASIIFKQSLWREKECLSNAIIKVATVHSTKMKPVALPESIRTILEQQCD